jgi:hypothetical protein
MTANAAQIGGLGGQAATLLNKPSIAVRGGAMFSPRSAGLAGIDVTIPSMGGDRGRFRADADVIFRANINGVKTVIPVTLNQIYYAPTGNGLLNLYYGAGGGAVFSGPVKWTAKFIVGTNLGNKLALEGNVYLTQRETLFLVAGRLKL